MATMTFGWLAGWGRKNVGDSLEIVLRLTGDDRCLESADVRCIALTVSDAQLCALARDLTRAAAERSF
jgi:hypothetical protein